MKKCKKILNVKTATWNKESNELFDYESEDTTKTIFTTITDGSIIKKSDKIRFVPKSEKSLQESNTKTKVLMSLDCDQDNFYVKRIFEDNSQISSYMNRSETPWIAVKHLKTSSSGYKLMQGDVIKLGRIKLKIWEIKLNSSLNDSIIENNENNTKHPVTKLNDKTIIENDNINTHQNNNNILKNRETTYKSKQICRICYCDESEGDSPLIQPCSCSGTMKYIHFSCLQKWLKLKVVIKSSSSENSICYSLKQIECELCKTLLPDFIKCKDKVYEMWDFKPQFKSYITFETLITEKNVNRVLYVINLDSKQNIRMGRGHDSDIRVTDISVSRFHALIKKEKDGSFRLEDNNSKFGTLVLIQSPKLNILETMPLPVQIGRSFILLSVTRPFSLFSCFCVSKKKLQTQYQVLNAQNIDFEKCNFIKIQNDDLFVDEDSDENNYNKSDRTVKLSRSRILSADEHNPNPNFEEINNKSEVFFKIIENKEEEEKDNFDEGDHNSNYIQNSSRIAAVDLNKKSCYLEKKEKLERASTNGEYKISFNAIKNKLKNDLESLRRFDFNDPNNDNNSNSEDIDIDMDIEIGIDQSNKNNFTSSAQVIEDKNIFPDSCKNENEINPVENNSNKVEVEK